MEQYNLEQFDLKQYNIEPFKEYLKQLKDRIKKLDEDKKNDDLNFKTPLGSPETSLIESDNDSNIETPRDTPDTSLIESDDDSTENIITLANKLSEEATYKINEVKENFDEIEKLDENVDNVDEKIEKLQPIKRSVINNLTFIMFVFVAIFQILALGDVVQGSVTATGAILTRTSNTLIQKIGYMLAGLGIGSSLLPMPQIVKSMNDVANSHISAITSQIQLYDDATVDSVVKAFRNDINNRIGEVTGPIFQWVSVGKPEISGLIGPGPAQSSNIQDVGFRLTDEMIKRLDGSSNLFNQILQNVALKTPPNVEVAVWEPTRDLFAEEMKKVLHETPSLGAGSTFNNTLNYVWAKKPDIDPDTALTVATEFLFYFISRIPVVGAVIGQITKPT